MSADPMLRLRAALVNLRDHAADAESFLSSADQTTASGARAWARGYKAAMAAAVRALDAERGRMRGVISRMGQAGGFAAARAMTPQQRTERARKAADARWRQHRGRA